MHLGLRGIFIPERNAFDFVERPEAKEHSIHDKKRDPDSCRSRLERTIVALKKANKKSSFGPLMATTIFVFKFNEKLSIYSIC